MQNVYQIRKNQIHENNSMYSSRPLLIYRNELVQCDTVNVIEKHNQQSQIECNTLARDAKQRSRCNVRQGNNTFQNSRQYLQRGNKVCDEEIDKCSHGLTEKWSNPTFSQNGGVSSSAQIARTVYNNTTVFKKRH
jgi:hypothetical protein